MLGSAHPVPHTHQNLAQLKTAAPLLTPAPWAAPSVTLFPLRFSDHQLLGQASNTAETRPLPLASGAMEHWMGNLPRLGHELGEGHTDSLTHKQDRYRSFPVLAGTSNPSRSFLCKKDPSPPWPYPSLCSFLLPPHLPFQKLQASFPNCCA